MSTNNNNIVRRDFLKQSALVTGGVLAGSWPLNVQSSVDDTIKVALIGCGGRGIEDLIYALESGPDVRVVALADAFRDAIDTAQKRLSEVKQINVPEEYKFVGLDAYKKAIAVADVVLLTAPPGFRPMHFDEAVRQGKHVFMEKPVATDVPGIRQVLAAAEMAKKKKLNVAVGFQRRYHEVYRNIVKRIKSGEIGDVVSGQIYWNGGGVWVRPRQPGQTEMEYQIRNWYYFNWLSGDHIVEQHVHQFDVANWIKGSYPVSIQGTGSRAWRKGKDFGEIYDNHAVELTYADGAVIYSQCRQFSGTHTRIDETFQGTKGRAYITSIANNKLADVGTMWDSKGKVIYDHPLEYNGDTASKSLHRDFFDAINKGEYRHAAAEYGAYGTLTGILGRIATYSGQVIKWDEALKSDISLMPERLAWDAMPRVRPNEDGMYPCAIPGQTVVI